MATQVKKMAFKGIDSKVEALLRSFLALAKSETDYQITILEDDHIEAEFIIVDEAYEFLTEEQALAALPAIKVGKDHLRQQASYLTLPVQWSEFKVALESIASGQLIVSSNFDETSVLVLETDSRDLWLEDDFGIEDKKQSEPVVQKENTITAPSNAAVRQPNSERVELDDEYYNENIELQADGDSLLYIRSTEKMVYSKGSPASWIALMQTGALSKSPLGDDWQPNTGLHCYPMARLMWVYTLLNDSTELADDLDLEAKYQLEKWPHFDLLENDNALLRLCAMLFTHAESVASIAAKSGFGRSSIIGLMNACHQQGGLKAV